MTGRTFQRLGIEDEVGLRLIETGINGSSRGVDVLEIVSRSDPGDIAVLGVILPKGKQLLGLVQREVVAIHCRELATRRPSCRSCAAMCQITVEIICQHREVTVR